MLLRGDPEAEQIWAWCCEGVGRFPDLPERQLDVGKSYRWLPFALSAQARKRSRWPKPAPTDPRFWNDPESGFDHLIEQAWDADRAMKLVSEFQRFFAEAAERGEDVLAVWD